MRLTKMKIAIVALILGFLVGVVTSIYLFAIDVDILAIPYVNKGVILKKDIVIEQDGIQLQIPKETQVTLVHQTDGWNKYGIYFYVYWDDETLIEAIPSKPKSFELKKEEKGEMQ